MTELGKLWAGYVYGTNTGKVFLELEQNGEKLSGTFRFLDDKYGIAVYKVDGDNGENISLLGQPKHSHEGVELGDLKIEVALTPEGRLKGKWESTLGTGGLFLLYPHGEEPKDASGKALGVPEQIYSQKTQIGNLLNRIVNDAKAALFDQGELAQLTYGAFDIAASSMQGSENEEIQVTFPVGYKHDKTAIQSTRTYKKEELLGRYRFLAFHQLSVNGLVQLVTVVEAMLNDLVRATVLKYPNKLGSKRKILMKVVLEATTVEEVHLRATDGLLNDLSYMSPSDFSEAIQPLLSVNLLECPSFHKYVEIKATRDVYIHNRGIANEIYVRKAGTHSRVQPGFQLHVDIQYFLESYEACLQMTEWLEIKLNEIWHSSEYENRQKLQSEVPIKNT